MQNEFDSPPNEDVSFCDRSQGLSPSTARLADHSPPHCLPTALSPLPLHTLIVYNRISRIAWHSPACPLHSRPSCPSLSTNSRTNLFPSHSNGALGALIRLTNGGRCPSPNTRVDYFRRHRWVGGGCIPQNAGVNGIWRVSGDGSECEVTHRCVGTKADTSSAYWTKSRSRWFPYGVATDRLKPPLG